MEYHLVHGYRRCILALGRFVACSPYAIQSNATGTLFVKRSQGDTLEQER